MKQEQELIINRKFYAEDDSFLSERRIEFLKLPNNCVRFDIFINNKYSGHTVIFAKEFDRLMEFLQK